jgi:sulfatase maturation enzyme AslB (radical SAM superfamily)
MNKIILKAYGLLRLIFPGVWVQRMATNAIRGFNFLKFGDIHFPRAIAIEITSHCNRTCYYCPQSVNPTGIRKIERPLYLQCLNRIAESGFRGSLNFHFYNEPLLEMKLEEMVTLAVKTCPRTMPVVVTNGDALTAERIKSLVAAGVRNFFVNRHPPYSDKWDAKIKGLAEMFPAHVFLSMPENGELSNRGGLVKPKRVRDISKGCFTTTAAMHIDIDGNYLFCCCDYNKLHPMGNVRTQTVAEAWNNQKYRQARREVQRGNPVLEICKACFKTG